MNNKEFNTTLSYISTNGRDCVIRTMHQAGQIVRSENLKDFILITLLILLMIRNFIKNKDTLREFKKLNKAQLLGVAINFILTVIVATVLIFYGGNWIAGQFSNIFLKTSVFAFIVLLVLYFIGSLSNKAMSKITHGILPKD